MLQTAGIKTIPYKTAFVVNPTAGDGKAGRIWPEMEEELSQSGQQYRAYFTRRAGDGTVMAARACDQGAELIVALGGDGTLREVLNGLDVQKNIMAVIPAGTGNGFIRSLSIPLNWHKAFQGLYRWEPRRIDIGRVNNELFLNSAGIGLDGAVAEAVSGRYKSLKGYPAYAVALVEQAASFSRFQCKVKCDGQYLEEDQALLALITNGRYYGGKLCIAPQASINDGYFDLLVIRKGGIWALLSLGARVAVRKHLSSKSLTRMRGQTISLETSRLLPLQIDGDVWKTSSVDVKIIPAALQILAPKLHH